jgi:hypothetical protein
MAAGNPLARQIEVVTFTDSEMRQILKAAADEAAAVTARLGEDSLRSVQVNLAKANAEAWAGIGSAARVGVGDAAYSATEYQALFDEQLFSAAGLGSSYWRASMLATAQQGVESLIARKENGITLSQRVWRDSERARMGLDNAINSGLLLGKSPAEIAKDVKGFLNPDVPGGASYAAMRLGRTEVLNAYHTTAINNYKNTPWVHEVEWHLSGSHPRPDACNDYADAGTYAPNEVPDKPHPNCLCYITPVVENLATFKKNFDAGKYDSHIQAEMGCFSA